MVSIRELRHRLALSQQAFATRLGISIRGLANYEATEDRSIPIHLNLLLWAIAGRAGFGDLAKDFGLDFCYALDLEQVLKEATVPSSWKYQWPDTNNNRVVTIFVSVDKISEIPA
jgi:transcriptional regulator with XRE-family HTH domain